MTLIDASKTYLIETYVQEWVKTVGNHLSVEFAWGTGFDPFRRMRILCKKCDQTLTCGVPYTPQELDWSIQKFVNLHRHDPIAEAEEKHKQKLMEQKLMEQQLLDMAKANKDKLEMIKATAFSVKDWAESTGLTADFKPIQAPIQSPKPLKPLKHKEGRKFRETN